MSVTRSGPIQTLDRGLRVLELLADASDGLTVGEIAERMQIHRAAAYRLTSTLEARHYVARSTYGRYRLWTGVLGLSRGVLPAWRAISSPILTELAAELDVTAHLTVIDGEEAVAIAVVEPTSADIHLSYRPGVRHPLSRGASGKAILAGRPAHPGESLEISQARAAGFATSTGELQPGVFGAAAPIIVGNRPAEASIGVIALDEITPAAIERVVGAADQVADRLAARG